MKPMKISFYLRGKSIYSNFAWRGNRLQIATGLTVNDPQNFNPNPTKRKPQYINGTGEEMTYKNNRLDDIWKWAEKVFFNDDRITKEEFKILYRRMLKDESIYRQKKKESQVPVL